ncbi:type 1 glutamine amidotransferase domain-containing protein [Maricurvus nonylphenolicus]|uniref:type 1 glutamine amidotransferase domain-containing protein n=1 Tax=Maricurvus nonylphenolicus TaxID=1008307 RepID=UPI0036F3DA37
MSLLPFKSKYKPSNTLDLKCCRALVITTSHGSLDKLDPDSGTVIKKGKPTGVYASEMTDPYYVFLDAGMDVDIASIQGGEIPIEPGSLNIPLRTEYDKRYIMDPLAQRKVKNSLKIDDLDFRDYDIIMMAGGWGAAYDLAQSSVLSKKVSEAYEAGKILGGICHGGLGFIGAVKPDGSPLVEGVKMTAVTDRQVKQLGIGLTPKHPETELRREGADFKCNSKGLVEFFNDHVEVDEQHRIVTGQNQKGGVEASDRALMLLHKLSA